MVKPEPLLAGDVGPWSSSELWLNLQGFGFTVGFGDKGLGFRAQALVSGTSL